MIGLIGKKLGMTEVFGKTGEIMALTVIEAGPCTVVQEKTTAKDGYRAAQLGFGTVKKLKSPIKGHLKNLGQFHYLREFRLKGEDTYTMGQKVDVTLFKPGDKVNITGVSKGCGFAGVVKRYHFKGGPQTHGQSDRLRHPGAIGSTTTPGRVWKGQRMAGHMGDHQVTALNLEVYQADPARNLILVKGAVPGARNGLLLINKSERKK